MKWAICTLYVSFVIFADYWYPSVEIIPNARPHIFTAWQSGDGFRNNTETAFYVWTHNGDIVRVGQIIKARPTKAEKGGE